MDPNLQKFLEVHSENVTKGRKSYPSSRKEAIENATHYLYAIGLNESQVRDNIDLFQEELTNGIK